MLISAGDLIKKSFALYKQNGKLFLKYVLLSYVPGVILAVAGLFLGGAAGVLFFAEKKGSAGIALAVLIILVIAAILASIWIFLAFIRVIATRYLNKPEGKIGEELKKSTPLILPYIGASILFGLIIFGGTILFIIPGIIFAIWFSFYFYEIALDNKGVMDSLKGSKKLVSGRWWGILWRLVAPAIVFAILTFILQMVVQLPFSALAQNASSTAVIGVASILMVVLNAAISALIAPLTATAQVVLYIEAKNTPVGGATPIEPTPTEEA